MGWEGLILPQSNFSVKVKGQQNRGRQIGKGTGIISSLLHWLHGEVITRS